MAGKGIRSLPGQKPMGNKALSAHVTERAWKQTSGIHAALAADVKTRLARDFPAAGDHGMTAAKLTGGPAANKSTSSVELASTKVDEGSPNGYRTGVSKTKVNAAPVKLSHGAEGKLTPDLRRALEAEGFKAESTGGHSKRGFARKNTDDNGPKILIKERIEVKRADGAALTPAHVAKAKEVIASHRMSRAETLEKVGLVHLRTVRARDNVTLTANELKHDIAETARQHGKPITFGEAQRAAESALAKFRP